MTSKSKKLVYTLKEIWFNKSSKKMLIVMLLGFSLTFMIIPEQSIIATNPLNNRSKLSTTTSNQYELNFSSFFGGSSTETTYSTAVDNSGNIYIAGSTLSKDLPMINSWNSTPSSSISSYEDGFIAKFNPMGDLLFSTYLGGNNTDIITGIAVGTNQNLYVTGSTSSTDFPVKNAYQPAYKGGTDAFLTEFSSNGTLLFSTYLGGSTSDAASAIAIDSAGNIFLTGSTTSQNTFPLKNSWNKSFSGSNDIFIAKYSPNGELLSSSFLGGVGQDFSYSIAVDSNDNIYLTGITQGDFPITSNAYQKTYGSGTVDSFVTKINSTGTIVYSTYLGTSDLNYGYYITVDVNGSFYVTGKTDSASFPVTSNAYSNSLNNVASSYDSFIIKFNASGSLVYSSYLGGNGNDYGYGIHITKNGEMLIMGETSSTNFPVTSGSFNTSSSGSYDCFITKFKSDFSLDYSTYYGGSSIENCESFAIDSNENIIIGGTSSSTTIPTTSNSYYTANSGGSDSFVVKFTNLQGSQIMNNPTSTTYTTSSTSNNQSTQTSRTSQTSNSNINNGVSTNDLLTNPIFDIMSGIALLSVLVNLISLLRHK